MTGTMRGDGSGSVGRRICEDSRGRCCARIVEAGCGCCWYRSADRGCCCSTLLEGSCGTWALERNIVIGLSLAWRLALLVAAVGLLPTVILVNWVARQVARSCLGARLRGWWRS